MRAGPGGPKPITADEFKNAKQNVISEFERRYISRLLAQHDGNISAAAKALGISRNTIYRRIDEAGGLPSDTD